MKRLLFGIALVTFLTDFVQAQTNIAPQATFTASYNSATLGPTKLNDLNFGTCGTQQMWLQTATPPSTTIGAEWIAWEWPSARQIEEIIIHHGQTSGRYMNGASLQVQSGSSWTTVHTFSNLTVQCVNSVKFPRVRAKKMRLTAFKVASGGQQSNINFREFELIEAPEFNNDAGISGLVKPGIPVCSTLDDSLDIIVRNYGIKAMDSCIINWKVNDTLQTPLRFVNTLPPGGVGIYKTTYHRTLMINDSLEFWTTMPNGKNDSMPENDTLFYVLIDGLSGTYNVGGSSAHYSTLDSAIMDLNKRGVCTPVTFLLHDSTNQADVSIKWFNGTSAQRWVTFKSASGNSASCAIYDMSSNVNDNYSLQMDGASYLKFENLTISNGNSGSFAGVINMMNGNNNITFTNCHIKTAYSGSSTNAYLVNSGDKSGDQDVSFNDCLFEGGSWGIHTEGDKQNEDKNWKISNSEFKNTFRSAIWMLGMSKLEISSNVLYSNSVNSTSGAINLDECYGYSEVYGNKIYHSADWPQTGLRIQNSAGLSSQHSLIMNNSFSIGDTSGVSTVKRGMHLTSVGFFDVRFNTIAIGTSNATAAAFLIETSNGNSIQNNVFASMNSGGIAVDISGLGSVLKMDNNLLYSLNGNLGKFNGSSINTLSSWQSNTGFDGNSVSEDPMFRSVDTLKICSKNADNIGLGYGLVVDVDGNLRDANSPDPGAFEYSAISGISVADQRICNGDTATFFVGAGKNDVIIWNHVDTGQVYKTPMKGSYTLTAFGECGADTTTFNVDINALVQLPNDTNICGGDTLNVVASINNGTYLWNDNSTNQNLGVYSNGQYFVNATDSDGCFSSDTIEVTVSKMAVLRTDTTVCSGRTVELDPGTSGGTYTWFRDGISFSTASKVFADSAGKYAVSFVDPKMCVSSDTFNLTVAAQPNAAFTTSQNNAQNNVRFDAVDTTGSNYYWSFGDGKSVNGPAWYTLNKYIANGNYQVTLVMTSQYCGDSTLSKNVEVRTIGFEEFANSNEFIVFPNPSNGLMNIAIPAFNADLDMEIVSLTGQTLFIENNIPSESVYSMDLQSTLSTGIYLINIKSEGAIIFTQKITIK